MNDFIKKLAPMIGTALGGPLGGMAVTAIGNALGLSDATEQNIRQAIQGATPAELLAVKKADAEFALQMQALGFKNISDLEAIAAGDRDSARNREIAVKDRTPAILAYIITFGFFGVLGYMLAYGVPEVHGDAILVMLGSLGTAWAGCVSYYFGSSAGSSKKDHTIAGLSKQ